MAFRICHARHREVYEAVCRLARQAKRAGRSTLGIGLRLLPVPGQEPLAVPRAAPRSSAITAPNTAVAGLRRVARPSRPADVSGEAAKEWDRVVPELEQKGLLARADRACAHALLRALG